MNDLIKRLRIAADTFDPWDKTVDPLDKPVPYSDLMREAANELERESSEGKIMREALEFIAGLDNLGSSEGLAWHAQEALESLDSGSQESTE